MVISAMKQDSEVYRDVRADVSEPFTGKSFDDIYERARMLESLVAALGSRDVFEFQAVYDVEKDLWTGFLYNRSLTTGPNLYNDN